MNNKAWEGVIWTIIAGLCGFGAAKSSDRDVRLVASLAASGGALKAADCFYSSAKATYQQLAPPREYRQLPSHTHWGKVSKNSSGPSEG